MKLSPLATNVVAKKVKPAQTTASGILLGSTKESEAYTEVESVGPEVKSVAPGDKIITKDYSGASVKIDSDDYLIIEEKDILAILK